MRPKLCVTQHLAALLLAGLLSGIPIFGQANSDTTSDRAKDSGAAATDPDSFARWHGHPQETHTTESGLQYKILRLGDGPRPDSPGSKVTVLYRGFLENGQQFDTTYEWGLPLEAKLKKTIDGWVEGVQLMPTGSKFAFLIPPELAYGKRGRDGIPPHATLLFEIELEDVRN